MVFFTRELYEGVQDGSGWSRRATREWDRRGEVYDRDLTVIAPFLPATVRQFSENWLHDADVRGASFRSGELVLVLDTAAALEQYRGPRPLRLTFRGVNGRVRTARLLNQTWLYQETHLRTSGRFSLHVLFDEEESEVEASELQITRDRRTAETR